MNCLCTDERGGTVRTLGLGLMDGRRCVFLLACRKV